jgi:hypothetical protein
VRLDVASSVGVVNDVLVIVGVSHQCVHHMGRVHLAELLDRSTGHVNSTSFAVSAADLLDYLLFMLLESGTGLLIIGAELMDRAHVCIVGTRHALLLQIH